jgi:hypothetical protein
MVTFIGIENRAGNFVAVFDRGWDSDRGRTFCLNRDSLQRRINNIHAGLDNPARDASEEESAMVALDARIREAS